MHMRWHDLLFAHWPLPPAVIAPLLPLGLDVDTYDGMAWIGVVPFAMSNVRPRFLPGAPTATTFLELNVRTYVKTAVRAGVWFFSLDAASRLAVRAARAWVGLPYFDAEMSCEANDAAFYYASRRTHRDAADAEFRATYQPTGPVYRAQPGSLDHWLTERYALFAPPRHGRIRYVDIHHDPWPLQRAAAVIDLNTMTAPHGIPLPQSAPLLHYARRLDVVAWNVTSVPER
jgi:uncharacterized protein YqjF (DUF2071 family)